MLKKTIPKEELKALLTFYKDRDFETYYEFRTDSLTLIDDLLEGKAKDYFYNLINKLDHSFNNNDEKLITGINNMLDKLPTKNSEKDFQLISFFFIQSGDYSIRIRPYKTVIEDNHKQDLNAVDYGDLGNYYLEDLTEMYNESYYNDFTEGYEDDLEDLFYLMKDKKMTQVEFLIKECVSKYNLSQLNITYPLYIYIDFEDSFAGSGNLITKIHI